MRANPCLEVVCAIGRLLVLCRQEDEENAAGTPRKSGSEPGSKAGSKTGSKAGSRDGSRPQTPDNGGAGGAGGAGGVAVPWDQRGTDIRQQSGPAGVGGGGGAGGGGSRPGTPGGGGGGGKPKRGGTKSRDPDRAVHLALRSGA